MNLDANIRGNKEGEIIVIKFVVKNVIHQKTSENILYILAKACRFSGMKQTESYL